eukprot:snap_masked-scaffold_2-processed-gene-4.33-mRNA-1 protein AED:1.00 eAED:1.00 QI:0/0/0/0/1/1/2/0/62
MKFLLRGLHIFIPKAQTDSTPDDINRSSVAKRNYIMKYNFFSNFDFKFQQLESTVLEFQSQR